MTKSKAFDKWISAIYWKYHFMWLYYLVKVGVMPSQLPFYEYMLNKGILDREDTAE